MTQSLFVSAKSRATWKKVCAIFLTLSINLTGGAGMLLLGAEVAYAADTTSKSPTSSSVSPSEWTSPSNAYSSDNAYSTASDDDGASRDDQRYSSFGFSVPAGATINGIEVALEAKSTFPAIPTPIDSTIGGFGTGSTDTNVPMWSEDNNSGTVALEPETGDDSVSPNGGRFARIADDGYICLELDGKDLSALTLSYYWRGDVDAEDGDSATVQYKTGASCNAGDSSWTTLATHELDNNNTGTSTWSLLQSVSIPDLNQFSVRFKNGNQNASDEHFRVDGVTLTGTQPTSACQIEGRIGDGSTFSSFKSATLIATDSVYTLGGVSDLWSGVTWSPTDFSNTNFRLELRGNDPGSACQDNATLSLDHAQVKVHYTPPQENTLQLCTDTIDNDGDNLIDLADSNCAQYKPTLTVKKHVDGGPMSPENFLLHVNSGDGFLGSETGTSFTYNSSTQYSVTEDQAADYVPSFDGCSGTVNAGDAATCTVTNHYDLCLNIEGYQSQVPSGHERSSGNCTPLNDTPPLCEANVSTITRVSNTTNVNVGSVGGDDAVLVDFDTVTIGQQVHIDWNASIAGAQWIWGENPVATPQSELTESFFDVFTVVGTPTGGTLEIAADNSYVVKLNGIEVGADISGNNYNSTGQDLITIPANKFVAGSNTLEIIVKNWAYDTTDPQVNPAGLLYSLTINKNSCVPVVAPVCEPQVNLVENGGFENPVLNATSYQDAWDIVPFTDSALKWLGEFVTAGGAGRLGLEVQTSAAVPLASLPYSGTQLAELDGDHLTRIYQDVITIPGHDYSLKYYFSPRPSQPASENILEVALGGGVVDTHTGAGGSVTSWTPYTKTFVATATVTRVSFADIGNDDNGSTGGVGSYLDDVSFSCVGPHVEVPPTTPENTPQLCNDQLDNDNDNLIDGHDSDCKPTLTVTKNVVNNNGLSKSASQFNLHVNEDQCTNILGMQSTVPVGMYQEGSYCEEYGLETLNTIFDFFSPKVAFAVAQLIAPASFVGNEQGTTVYFDEPSDYTVTEDADGQYTTTYGDGCTGSIGWGEHKTCVVTNDDIQQGGGGGGSSSFDHWGCTNPAATNFNSLSNRDDGSCQLPGGNGGTPQGEVLGAATTVSEPEMPLPAACAANPYLLDYMKMGKKNDVEQVKLLQTFLNEFLGTNIPVTGIFGPRTKAAVKKLQKDNHAAIIQPWIDAGFSAASLKEGTGVVYKTTKYFINKKKCVEMTETLPNLTNDTGLTN